MAQLGDTVITGSLAVSNCIYGSVTCATCSTTSTNACKGWNGSAFASFGSNAFNSTTIPTKVSQLTNDSGFTTNTGTVTSINIYCKTTCICSITSSGSICLGTNAFNSTTIPTKVSQLTNDSGFTTNTGTVTSVNIKVNGCVGTAVSTSGTIELSNVPACIGRTAYSNAYDFDVLLTNGASTVVDQTLYVSSSHRLRYCSTTGYLRITDSADRLAGKFNSAYMYASCYLQTPTIYSISPSANTKEDITIYVRCCNASSMCSTTFVFCSTTGRLHANICGGATSGWNGSAFASFGSNAFNSTAFTTCTGTVTKVKVGTTEYTPSSGVISLPAYPTTVSCASDSALLTGKAPANLCVCKARYADYLGTHYTDSDVCMRATYCTIQGGACCAYIYICNKNTWPAILTLPVLCCITCINTYLSTNICMCCNTYIKGMFVCLPKNSETGFWGGTVCGYPACICKTQIPYTLVESI